MISERVNFALLVLQLSITSTIILRCCHYSSQLPLSSAAVIILRNYHQLPTTGYCLLLVTVSLWQPSATDHLFVIGATPCLLHKACRISLSLFQPLFLQFQLWLRGSSLLSPSYSSLAIVCHLLPSAMECRLLL